MPDIGWPEILIIAVVVLVLFGTKKMPDAARSLGRSMRIFKREIKGLHEDDNAPQSGSGQTEQLTAAPGAPAIEQQVPASPIGENVDGR